jgi:putative PIN family toxin of toxin-antitoxin system
MRIKEGSRIVIDTNIWISFLIGKHFSSLEEILYSKALIILYSSELVRELDEVLSSPKFRKYFNKEEREIISEIFKTTGEKIKVTSKVKSCRDLKDNFLLALCKDGQADYLLSGDNDLLEIGHFYSTKIISYKTITNA